LISIFAKRNGVVPTYDKAKGLKPEKSSSRDRHSSRRQSQKKTTGKNVASTDSAIEEEYSIDFSDSVPKEESIAEDDLAKHISSSRDSSKHK
jgi:hypothetical protein